ncbi:MAG TPA: hypothetical protein IGS17_02015 [Oscillatoriales cyanobacterium M59_W2019_021]|nr:MAG: hypothetical protein D6728_15965 [Cyanobacteria bacterium J055]HIK32055.1 hypothetical protein [Oscillatoriales cyanobacterium M4454_W2019_049]HIK49691.1 hypothetical protein [Oscillatoriales cyanobacterium M59_W2019_021]
MNPSRPSYSLTARTLKTVGAIVIIASLVDYLVLPIPFQPLDLPWRVQIATQIVDRGIIPMMGLGFLFAGYWVASTTTSAAPPQNKLLDMRFWALVLSSLLGLFFLILAPLHLRDVSVASNQRLAQISQEAQNQEAQLETQLGSEELQQRIEQQKEALKAVAADETQRQALIDNPATPPELKKILQESKENPQALEDYLNQQAQALPDQLTTQLREQKQTAEQQIRLNAWKSGLRIGVSSLLLAIGYIIIGWTGLKGMMGGIRAKSKPSMG